GSRRRGNGAETVRRPGGTCGRFAAMLYDRTPSAQEPRMSEAAVTNAPRDAHPLDTVVWNALTSKQRGFAVGDERALRFPAAIAPLAAVADDAPASFAALRTLMDAHGPVALVTPRELAPPDGFAVARRATLLQMIWQGEPAASVATEHVRLTDAD